MCKKLVILALIRLVVGKMEPFIIGGMPTKIYKYPHTALLSLSCRVDFICGGSILNQYIVLTAAHCFEDCGSGGSVMVKYGHEDIDRMQATSVRSYLSHENYGYVDLRNDIALVLCRRPIKFGNVVKRVVIMKHAMSMNDLYVAGYGVINRKKQLPKTLQETSQKVQPKKVCRKLGTIPAGTFCAGPLPGQGVPDEGDSGCALIYKNYIQIGIVSYKVKMYTLVVYTNVTYHHRWITANSVKLYCMLSGK